MTVRLRLAVHGVRHNKIFHLVAIDQRKRRNAKPIELLGVYRPRVEPNSPNKSVEWSVDRIKYWLGVGAQPSDSVVKLLTTVRPTYVNLVLRAFEVKAYGETGKGHTTGFEMAFQAYAATATLTKHTSTTATTMTTNVIDNCCYMLCLIGNYRHYCPSFSTFTISS